MIQANELRIGNLIYYDNRVFEIDTLAKEIPTLNTIEFGIGVVNWNDLKPIPITEEWLLKLGFRESESNLRKGNIIIRFGENDRLIITLIDQIVLPKIQYIHQLQNLYFAIYQNELECK